MGSGDGNKREGQSVGVMIFFNTFVKRQVWLPIVRAATVHSSRLAAALVMSVRIFDRKNLLLRFLQ